MPMFPVLVAVGYGTALAVVCAMCATKPRQVAAYVRKTYSASPNWVRNWPFASLVMKTWFPVYLRVVRNRWFYLHAHMAQSNYPSVFKVAHYPLLPSTTDTRTHRYYQVLTTTVTNGTMRLDARGGLTLSRVVVPFR